MKERVFNDIIALCHKRILSRLRSTHAEVSSRGEKRNKSFLGNVVRNFIALLWPNTNAQSTSPLVQQRYMNGHRSALERLLVDLDDFEATNPPNHQEMSRIVKSITQVINTVPIKALLDSIRGQYMEGTQQKWLFNCFNKIRRYSEVASILCHRARRIPMLRNIRVRIVSDVVNLEDDSISTGSAMDIWESLARFEYKGKRVQGEMLPEWLKCLTQSSVKKYSQSVRGILKEAKVHAEIQLLTYYSNEHVKGIRPRVLASNKKACALCNTFIAMHKEYSVPKSHGKLYKGWRLPAEHQNGASQDGLNKALEDSILETLESLMPLSERPRPDFCNESSIFSFTLSASTLPECSDSTISDDTNAAATVVDSELGSEHLLNEDQVSESAHTEHTTTTGEAGDENEDTGEENTNARALEHTDDQANAPMPHNSILTDGSTTSLSRQPADVRLKHRQTMLFDPEHDGMACFQSSRIEMIIDETSSRFSFELLGATEAEAVLYDETKHKADVRTISCGMDVLLPKCADGQVYITHGKEVIKICARPG